MNGPPRPPGLESRSRAAARPGRPGPPALGRTARPPEQPRMAGGAPAAERLARMPALAALIRALGRRERSPQTPPPAAPPARIGRGPAAAPARRRNPPARRARRVTGMRHFSGRHRPACCRPRRCCCAIRCCALWRARQAEAGCWPGRARPCSCDWRATRWRARARQRTPGPATGARPHPAVPGHVGLDARRARKIAKAVVIAALRAAHETGRGCR
jgi:hypothetical protein